MSGGHKETQPLRALNWALTSSAPTSNVRTMSQLVKGNKDWSRKSMTPDMAATLSPSNGSSVAVRFNSSKVAGTNLEVG